MEKILKKVSLLFQKRSPNLLKDHRIYIYIYISNDCLRTFPAMAASSHEVSNFIKGIL